MFKFFSPLFLRKEQTCNLAGVCSNLDSQLHLPESVKTPEPFLNCPLILWSHHFDYNAPINPPLLIPISGDFKERIRHNCGTGLIWKGFNSVITREGGCESTWGRPLKPESTQTCGPSVSDVGPAAWLRSLTDRPKSSHPSRLSFSRLLLSHLWARKRKGKCRERIRPHWASVTPPTPHPSHGSAFRTPGSGHSGQLTCLWMGI